MKNADKPINPTTQLQSGTGLTKREYFAGLAMQGLLSNTEFMDTYEQEKRLFHSNYIAEKSIELADSLLNQLEK